MPHIDPADRDAARIAYEALADKAIDGYQVRRRIVKPDGEVLTVCISGRRIDGPDRSMGCGSCSRDWSTPTPST